MYKNYRVLFIAPYENQIRLIFKRIRELIDASPMIKDDISITFNPFELKVKSTGSSIMGFTTGALSGNGAASIRGQAADAIFIDELDYCAEGDYDAVTAIAAERNDISLTISSTPTGKRGPFYHACVNKKLNFSEHYHPSTDNPNWCDRMESEFREQLSEQGYVHEILAEFGTQETGVFNKTAIDTAIGYEHYTYQELSYIQNLRIKNENITVLDMIYETDDPPYNPFRTMGVDYDKYGATSSILILDYDIILGKFRVIKRIEVPRGEYSYDNAVNMIVELNKRYNPSFIFCDRGSGEYQLERLHILGTQNPGSNLDKKVIGFSFAQKLDIIDPVTGNIDSKPMKPFMVSQLQIAFERNNMILSEFDEILYKQLIDYEVVRISQAGQPVFTDINEHSIDALGLAYLAFVLKFPDLTKTIKEIEHTSNISQTRKTLGTGRAINQLWQTANTPFHNNIGKQNIPFHDERNGEHQQWFKVSNSKSVTSVGWGKRTPSRGGRSMW